MRRQEAGPNSASYKPNPAGDPAKYAASSNTGGFRRTGASVNSSLNTNAGGDKGKYAAASTASSGFRRTGQLAGPAGSQDKSVTAHSFAPMDGQKQTIEKKIADE
jgi:hypothetical protein